MALKGKVTLLPVIQANIIYICLNQSKKILTKYYNFLNIDLSYCRISLSKSRHCFCWSFDLKREKEKYKENGRCIFLHKIIFLHFINLFINPMAYLVTEPHTAKSTTCQKLPICCNFRANHSISIFKASALLADAFYKSKCLSVCLSVRVSVCLSVCSLLRYRLTFFLPPLPEVGCQIFFRDSESFGKSNGKKWSNN